MRLIDVDDAIRFIQKVKGKAYIPWNEDTVIDFLESRQIVDPVSHGHWIPIADMGDKATINSYMIRHHKCSVCNMPYASLSPFKFCPNCGSQMVEVKDETD